MAKKEQREEIVSIPEINKKHAKIRVMGITPYLSHRKSDKSMAQIEAKEGQKPKQAKGKRDPQADYRDSLYWLNKEGEGIQPGEDVDKHEYGFGIPSRSFKKSCVNACRSVGNLKSTLMRNAFFVMPEYIPILNHDFKTFALPKFRKDWLPLPGRSGSSTMSYRGEFSEWACELQIEFNANVISLAQIANLLNLAGFGVGVGDDRPDKSGGIQGRFEVI